MNVCVYKFFMYVQKMESEKELIANVVQGAGDLFFFSFLYFLAFGGEQSVFLRLVCFIIVKGFGFLSVIFI
jgi:hypothetical protein